MRQASAGASPALACGSSATERRGAAGRSDGLKALPHPSDARSRNAADSKAELAVVRMPPARVLGEPGRRRRRLSVASQASG